MQSLKQASERLAQANALVYQLRDVPTTYFYDIAKAEERRAKAELEQLYSEGIATNV